MLERLTGWLILPILTFIGFVVNPGLTHLGNATRVALGLASATLVLLVVVLTLVASNRFGARFNGNQGWRRFAGAVHLGLDRLRHHPAAAVNVLAVGFAYQLALVFAALFAAKAVGMGVEVGPTALLAFFPAVAIAQVLPVGISGLGIREGAFALFLVAARRPTEQAVALGLLLYLLNLGVSLLGAPAFALGGRRRRHDLARLMTTVDDTDIAPAPPPPPALVARGPLHRRHLPHLLAGPERVRVQRRRPGESNRIAYQHALDIVRIEDSIGLFVERTIQRWYLDLPGDGFIAFWNVFYGTAHFIVTAFALIWCYHKGQGALPGVAQHAGVHHRLRPHRLRHVQPHAAPADGQHRRVRPAAGAQRRARLPLRRHPGHLRDVLVVRLRGARRTSPTSTPPCPASTWGGRRGRRWCSIPMVRRRWLKALIALHPIATLFCIVVTANHFWLDAVGGAGDPGAGFLVGRALAEWWERRARAQADPDRVAVVAAGGASSRSSAPGQTRKPQLGRLRRVGARLHPQPRHRGLRRRRRAGRGSGVDDARSGWPRRYCQTIEW